MERRAKIVATIGPATDSPEILRGLFEAGMNVARINFSHGSHDDHAARIKRLRAISKESGEAIAILQDLQGPKIRTGEIESGSVLLEAGQKVHLYTSKDKGKASQIPAERIPVDFADLPKILEKGDRILMDDGCIELNVLSAQKQTVEAEVVLGGELLSNKGINLPGKHPQIPTFTEKDKQDLEFGLEQGVDYVAQSFVRNAADILAVREAIEKLAPDRKDIPLIAKLERPEALENLEEIVEQADGVMVARGDLGIEMSPQEVPIAQKRIISVANSHEKLVITATQMLDSMVSSLRPTRAEASDVANAVFDGSDAVMLSGETAIGKYPIETVKMMDAIVLEAEGHLGEWGHWRGMRPEVVREDTTAITQAARELAHDLNVSAIAVFTMSGRTARLMSKAWPRVPILAFTPNEYTFQRMALYWGVFPHLVPACDSVEEMISVVEADIVEHTLIQPGQQVVLITGFPVGAHRPPNLALLHTIGTDV